MSNIEIGEFVRYKTKNEVGLVGDVDGSQLSVWWHTGGTRATIDVELVNKLSLRAVVDGVFENDYAKASLMERSIRVRSGKPTDDLIEGEQIRPGVNKVLKEF